MIKLRWPETRRGQYIFVFVSVFAVATLAFVINGAVAAVDLTSLKNKSSAKVEKLVIPNLCDLSNVPFSTKIVLTTGSLYQLSIASLKVEIGIVGKKPFLTANNFTEITILPKSTVLEMESSISFEKAELLNVIKNVKSIDQVEVKVSMKVSTNAFWFPLNINVDETFVMNTKEFKNVKNSGDFGALIEFGLQSEILNGVEVVLEGLSLNLINAAKHKLASLSDIEFSPQSDSQGFKFGVDLFYDAESSTMNTLKNIKEMKDVELFLQINSNDEKCSFASWFSDVQIPLKIERENIEKFGKILNNPNELFSNKISKEFQDEKTVERMDVNSGELFSVGLNGGSMENDIAVFSFDIIVNSAMINSYFPNSKTGSDFVRGEVPRFFLETILSFSFKEESIFNIFFTPIPFKLSDGKFGTRMNVGLSNVASVIDILEKINHDVKTFDSIYLTGQSGKNILSSIFSLVKFQIPIGNANKKILEAITCPVTHKGTVDLYSTNSKINVDALVEFDSIARSVPRAGVYWNDVLMYVAVSDPNKENENQRLFGIKVDRGGVNVEISQKNLVCLIHDGKFKMSIFIGEEEYEYSSVLKLATFIDNYLLTLKKESSDLPRKFYVESIVGSERIKFEGPIPWKMIRSSISTTSSMSTPNGQWSNIVKSVKLYAYEENTFYLNVALISTLRRLNKYLPKQSSILLDLSFPEFLIKFSRYDKVSEFGDEDVWQLSTKERTTLSVKLDRDLEASAEASVKD
ncbi:hypothetical protein ROZALSC1DRAFT_22720, partial [Rozella allomycis CSF55]